MIIWILTLNLNADNSPHAEHLLLNEITDLKSTKRSHAQHKMSQLTSDLTSKSQFQFTSLTGIYWSNQVKEAMYWKLHAKYSDDISQVTSPLTDQALVNNVYWADSNEMWVNSQNDTNP